MRRISIRSLMVFIIVSAVGLAALRNANELWAGIMLLVALAAVGVAVLGAVILRGRERCWWLGFALFCGVYLSLAITPWFSDVLGTTQVLLSAHERMNPWAFPALDNSELVALRTSRKELLEGINHVKAVSRNAIYDPAFVIMVKDLARVDQELAANSNATPPFDQFQRVGHSLFALLAGLVGGTVATWFYARRERAEAA